MEFDPRDEPVVTRQIWERPKREKVPAKKHPKLVLCPPFFDAIQKLWPKWDRGKNDIPWDRIYPLLLRHFQKDVGDLTLPKAACLLQDIIARVNPPAGTEPKPLTTAEDAGGVGSLTVTEAAKLTGLLKSTITRLGNRGKIESTGKGRARRIDQKSLTAYVLQNKRRDGEESTASVQAKVARHVRD